MSLLASRNCQLYGRGPVAAIWGNVAWSVFASPEVVVKGTQMIVCRYMQMSLKFFTTEFVCHPFSHTTELSDEQRIHIQNEAAVRQSVNSGAAMDLI